MVLKETYKRGYLHKIINTTGKKASVVVTQGLHGYDSSYSKSHKSLGITGRGAESLARRLARRGHKTVTILD